MSECIFCKIIDGTIPGKKAYEDEQVLAIHDISPAAPVHVLVMPKAHISSLAQLQDDQLALAGHILGVIRDLAQKLGLQEGYRVVINCGEEGGQTVDHLHFHLLGQRNMTWPPG
ncbi:MAG: histidine triad nucleotide-binding protein [Clostridia bacterium]|jgi:histidine triad (HIT) family protein|nr:histidine triad nucleotide-binding protein [Clostridia bacterium]